MNYLLVAVLSYLIGGIPLAYLIVRIVSGRDIRSLGTGNVGVMNTARQAGLPAGMLAFLGEGSKGIAALGVARWLAANPEGYATAGLAVLIGVNWSVFMGFRGGRGTTVTAVVAAILLWPVVVLALLIWLLVYRLSHDNFRAARVVIFTLPFVTAAMVLLFDESWSYVTYAVLGSLIVLSRHKRETDDHYIAATERAGSRH